MSWLHKTIEQGQAKAVSRSDIPLDDLVEFIVSLGIGSQFLARISNDAEKVKMLKKHALHFLKTA
ncbi:MAG: hypothetical protein H7249_01930 [Chitinophagaceae bacterium]|nr:hypothetical protein [Oligoflexus sp.]